MKKIVLKIVLGLFIALIILAVMLYFHMQSHAIVTTEEVIPTDESEQIERAIDNFIQVIDDTNSGLATRGAHAKGHACVKAYIDVNPTIEPQLQYGIFETAGTRYKSWIRFSNGSSNLAKSQDDQRDSRGMAIKIFNIEQTDKLIGAGTQDFLMHNSPAFFSTSLNDYNDLIESDDKIRFYLQGYNPFNWRLHELFHVIDTVSPPPYSPIWDEYFSNTAYKLGPHNIKFMVKSCSASIKQNNPDDNQPDFLKTTLATELTTEPACMQLMVQLQDASKLMPIEDPSVLWKQDESPFIRVATITIPQQQFDSKEQQHYCENLSFSPWNTLEAHRPIGALNRVRKTLYEASSRYRHDQNNQTVAKVRQW